MAEEVASLRLQIAALLAAYDPDAVGELPGICVVRSKGEVFGDCSCYVFNDVFDLGFENMWDAYLFVIAHWNAIENPLPGDLVIYYRDESVQHFGILCDNDLVESKFGYAHVYRHPLFSVPDHYGNTLRYFRRKKEMEE